MLLASTRVATSAGSPMGPASPQVKGPGGARLPNTFTRSAFPFFTSARILPTRVLRMSLPARSVSPLNARTWAARAAGSATYLGDAKYFSSLDLTCRYHQLGLQANDWPKTAFNTCTHVGKFEWRVLPFGMTNAPPVFQTAMNRIFGRQLY